MSRPKRKAAIEGHYAYLNTKAALYKQPGVIFHDTPLFDGHAAYIKGKQLFNANDCLYFMSEKPPIPKDGFHAKKYLKYERPLMLMKYSLHYSQLTRHGECALFANTIAKVIKYFKDWKKFIAWYHDNDYPDVGVRLLEFAATLP